MLWLQKKENTNCAIMNINYIIINELIPMSSNKFYYILIIIMLSRTPPNSLTGEHETLLFKADVQKKILTIALKMFLL